MLNTSFPIQFKTLKFPKNKIKLPISHWKRHIYMLLKYGTFKKHLNLLHAFLSWLFGKVHIKSLPAFLKIEISRVCKVGCKFCLTEKPTWFYSLENYKKIIDKFYKYSYLISLYDIGEPIEHEDLNECIRYAKSKKIGTVVSSSLAVQKPESFWEELVLSGLDLLIVAIDGTTATTYNKYRTNADFNLVMANLKTVIKFKNIHQSKICIEWQMIDFIWNKHEQDEAREMSIQMGCSRFRIIKEVVKARRNYNKENFIRTKNCILPYLILIITANNKVRPCYKIYNEPVEIGDLNQNTFEQIWNGNEVKRIRDKNLISCRTGCKTCKG